MCLAVPKKVVAVKKDFVQVKSGKKNERVGSLLKVKKGDWVLTQNKVIIKKITQKQAKEINNLLI